MNKAIFLITFLLFTNNNIFSADYESTNYISPGIGISWDFNSNLFLGLKVSFGKMFNEDRYYNITVGKKYLITNSQNSANTAYYHINVQAGSFLGRYPFSAGIGVGIAFFNDKTIYPRLSVFGDSGFFVNLDYVYKKNITDFGLKAILPVAFNERYRDFSQ